MGSLLLGSINDYLEHSQACTKPPVQTEAEDAGVAVTVNLTDCLACSGCITSAESLLVSAQSKSVIYNVVDDRRRNPASGIFASVSPQSVISLAGRFERDPGEIFARIVRFLQEYLKVEAVIDVAFAQWISLVQTGREFVGRWRRTDNLPLLSSTCPGWICFVEKRHGELIPHLSTTISPQQVCGVLVKDFGERAADTAFLFTIMPCYDRKLEASRSEFKVPILLADDDGDRKAQVDCVITTTEFIEMIEERMPGGISGFLELEPEGEAFKSLLQWTTLDPTTNNNKFMGVPGNGAGGYIAFILDYGRRHLFGDRTCCRVERIPGRNLDLVEYRLVDSSSVVLLRCAAIYGFRNIQTFIQQRQRRREAEGSKSFDPQRRTCAREGTWCTCCYDFVEVMACPGACLFGGGQPLLAQGSLDDTPLQKRRRQQAHNAKLEEIYAASYGGSLMDAPADWSLILEENATIQDVLSWADRSAGAKNRNHPLHTTYRDLSEATGKKAFTVQW